MELRQRIERGMFLPGQGIHAWMRGLFVVP
jgi:hypothetical protein